MRKRLGQHLQVNKEVGSKPWLPLFFQPFTQHIAVTLQEEGQRGHGGTVFKGSSQPSKLSSQEGEASRGPEKQWHG